MTPDAMHCRNLQIHRGRIRRGFTLVELLVVIAIIGMLVSLLLPAVNSARESARNIQCKNHLRQIALATIVFTDANTGAFPPARLERNYNEPSAVCAGRQPSWLVRILPYLEEEALFAKWDLELDFNEHPKDVRHGLVRTYFCPTRRGGTNLTVETANYQGGMLPCGCPGGIYKQYGGALGDYGANHGDPSPGLAIPDGLQYGGNGTGILISSRGFCGESPWILMPGWRDKIRVRHVKDGLSKTLLVGELHVPLGRLGVWPDNAPIFDGDHMPASARIGGVGYPIANGSSDVVTDFMSFGSWHPGGCNFALGDGSVLTLQSAMDAQALGRMCHRSDGTEAVAAR